MRCNMGWFIAIMSLFALGMYMTEVNSRKHDDI